MITENLSAASFLVEKKNLSLKPFYKHNERNEKGTKLYFKGIENCIEITLLLTYIYLDFE